MAEVVKRLEPTKEILRELFLKSGNECAFPGCNHKIISSNGVFLAQICHIEAANEGGQRFNENQTNEERRAFNNLLLMCHAHHKITDDTEQYPTERLNDIKDQHEAKFTDIVSTIQNSFKDHTAVSKIRPPKSLSQFNQVLGWNHNVEELNEMLEEVCEYSENLKNLPIQARQVFYLMVKRAIDENMNGLHISEHEIKLVTGAHHIQLTEVIQVLDKYGFIGEGSPDDMNLPTIQIRDIGSGWPFLKDLKDFSTSCIR